METASDRIEPFPDAEALAAELDLDQLTAIPEIALEPAAQTSTPPRPRSGRAGPRPRPRRRRLSATARKELLWITVIYLAVHLGLLLIAYLQNSSLTDHSFLNELANWDGKWYRELANKGYPAYVSHGQTTLGFFPLYPLTIWVVEHLISPFLGSAPIWWSATIAGALISCVGGLVATVLVHRLADGWWGRAVARRATVLFVVSPGAVVFTMVYSEGLLLPLAAGCIYALQKRRWLLAGVLAGFGTAVQPVGLVLVPVCLVSAALELRRHGWRSRSARRSLIAPALSGTGMASFMAFLWLWAGNPFANYIAQHHGWGEKTSLLALLHTTTKLAGQISFSHFDHPTINLNLVLGLIGAVVLVMLLVLLWFCRREVSAEAITWTLAISFLAFTSSNVPPNPRMLLTAFPALLTIARYAEGRWFIVIAWINAALLFGLSLLTFYGLTLRP